MNSGGATRATTVPWRPSRRFIPTSRGGAGAELRVIPFVPLRAGLTTLTGGMRYSAGVGFEFGVVNLQASASLLNGDGRNDTAGVLTLSFGGRW